MSLLSNLGLFLNLGKLLMGLGSRLNKGAHRSYLKVINVNIDLTLYFYFITADKVYLS